MAAVDRFIQVTQPFHEKKGPDGPRWERGELHAFAFDGYDAYIGLMPAAEEPNWTIRGHEDVEESRFRPVVAALARVPDADVYPAFEEGLDRFDPGAAPSGQAFFLKRPNLNVAAGKGSAAKLLLAEAHANQRFLQHPHTNLGGYLGCVVHDGRIVRLAFPRYAESLSDRAERAERGDLADFPLPELLGYVDGVEAAAAHLHALGYAHNDISAVNVMLTAENVPVLIDLDSCAKLGDKIKKGGIVGGWKGPYQWGQEFKESSVECDKASIQYMRVWLTRMSKGESNRNDTVI